MVRPGSGPALQPWTLIAAGAATVLQAKLSSWESLLALIGFCVLGSASCSSPEERNETSKPAPNSVRKWEGSHGS